MRAVKFFSPAVLGVNGADVNTLTGGQTVPGTQDGTQVKVDQYDDFMLTITYTGNPTTKHNLLVLIDDVIATPLSYPLVMVGFSAATAWTNVTLFFRFGKQRNVQQSANLSPLACSDPLPCRSFALQVVGSGVVAATVTARMWASREDGES